MDGGQSIPPTQNKGSYAKGGKPTLVGENLQTDPGCKAYRDSEWDFKTNGRAIAKNMHLLSEYTNYGDWETEATRRPMMLYNLPVSLGIEYFANSSEERKASKIDVAAGGFLKNIAMSKIDENEKAILGVNCTARVYDWMFKILRVDAEIRREHV